MEDAQPTGIRHQRIDRLRPATPDPAFFIVEVDDGEMRREVQPPRRRALDEERRRVPSRRD